MSSNIAFKEYLRNCTESKSTEKDWGFASASEAELVEDQLADIEHVDLREGCDRWWTIRDQGISGSCVGFAIADSVLRWVLVKQKRIHKKERLSVRFIWLASKEIDEYTERPTTFLERQGTSLKTALTVIYKYGVVPAKHLPFDDQEVCEDEGFTPLSRSSESAFYAMASQYRINGYFNLIGNLENWKKNPGDSFKRWRRWMASPKSPSPLAIRMAPDEQFINASNENCHFTRWQGAFDDRYHACAIVGFTDGHFIVRNSWSEEWGDCGYAYITEAYANEAISEAYGVILLPPLG